VRENCNGFPRRAHNKLILTGKQKFPLANPGDIIPYLAFQEDVHMKRIKEEMQSMNSGMGDNRAC